MLVSLLLHYVKNTSSNLLMNISTDFNIEEACCMAFAFPEVSTDEVDRISVQPLLSSMSPEVKKNEIQRINDWYHLFSTFIE